LIALLVALAGCGGSGSAATTTTAAQTAFCRGAQLTGRFAVVYGSAGAGNIVYRLALRNQSAQTCTVSGLPRVRLLTRGGAALPTHVTPARPGTGAAALIRLAPGAKATATARFSPDVPGVGEPVAGTRCERVASRLRVFAPGGGSTIVPIVPPTSVCEHGGLQFSLYRRA
jgi:hypothetical protein